MSKFCAATVLLASVSTSVFAHSEPQSYFQEFDCTIVRKCDHQSLCKTTDEPTQLTITSLIHDLSVSKLVTPPDHPFDTWQQVTAWVELTNPRAGKLPLPVWYLDDAGIDEDLSFHLEDWLSGEQDSPYNVKGHALVMTGDLEEIAESRSNLDKNDDLPWEITVYEKHWGETIKYKTQHLLCDSDL